jgi:exodeoxyribonuclease V alpha subunit
MKSHKRILLQDKFLYLCSETIIMERNYDLQDPTDLEILKSDFDMYDADDWQEMIDWSLSGGKKRSLSYDERGILMQARKKALYNNYPTPKQMVWALKIADKLESMKKQSEEEE